jgi:hypothetical protein
MLCAQSLRRALLEGRPENYWSYCSWVRRQISFGLKFRRLFLGLDQEAIERIFEVLGSEEAREVIETQADFDDHLRTAKAILRRPRLLAKLIKVSPSLIKALL